MAGSRQCERCVTDRELCDGCRHAPKYADYPNKSLFREYNPTCPVGEPDCIYDPAYIKCHHPGWYKEMYGDRTPEEVQQTKSCCDPAGDGGCYNFDDEDK